MTNLTKDLLAAGTMSEGGRLVTMAVLILAVAGLFWIVLHLRASGRRRGYRMR